MALEIKFNIPSPVAGQEPAFRVIWYQSNDGQVWDPAPIVSELVSALPLDTEGKYVWYSAVPSSARWSMIKTEDQYGVESGTGAIFPPDVLATSNYGASKIEDGITIYKIGATVDLMLQLDPDDALLAGEALTVQIKDYFDNIIATVTANLVGDDLYVAEWKIPVNLHDFYNTNTEDETDLDLSVYHLKDVWVFPNATQLEFPFFVSRTGQERAAEDNSLYIITIDNVNNSGIYEQVQFTSVIPQYYATVEDVISLSGSLSISNFDVARKIMHLSENVDLHMKPNVIANQAAYDSAVRCYVTAQAAIDLLGRDLGLEGESKKLDTFQITKQYGPGGLGIDLKDKRDKCALIIWAGGLDTPFKPRIFQKGLYDPNRPNYSRANLDISDNKPWVSVTTKPMLALDSDGRTIELRGVRTISLPSSGKNLL